MNQDMSDHRKAVVNLTYSLSKDTVSKFITSLSSDSQLAEFIQCDLIAQNDLLVPFDCKKLASLCDSSNEQSQLKAYDDLLFVIDSSANGMAHILRNQTDVSVDAAIEEWCSFLNAMFAVRKAQRSRIKLVIAQGYNSIADQYDLSGQLLCATHPDLMEITELLEASALPISNEVGFDINDCLQQVKTSEAQKEGLLKDSELKAFELEKHINELAEEKEAIFAQLFTVQENLEQLHISKDSQVTSLNVEVKGLNEKLKKSQKRIEELEADKASTIDQLLTTQESFKVLQDKHEAQVKQHQKSLQVTQEKLEVALADNQSLVQLKQSFESDRTTLVEENDLLLNQLLTVQESLEECYFGQQKLLFKLYPSLNKESQESDFDVDQNILQIARSEYFDALWYVSEYPEVIENSINPAEHYLTTGYLENKAPSPYFDGVWYLETHPDVASAQLNPLLHFELHGREEGRAAKFDLTSNDLTSE